MTSLTTALAPIQDFAVTDDDQFLRDMYDKLQHQNGR